MSLEQLAQYALAGQKVEITLEKQEAGVLRITYNVDGNSWVQYKGAEA